MLEQELDALLRQRDQYSLALDAATDPQASVRLQRTLDRLEDEIEGLQEALAALPAQPEATAVPPPDWEDEPATAIFDPEVMPAPQPQRRAPDPEEITQPVAVVPPSHREPAAPKPSEEVTDPARPLYDIEVEMQREIDLAASLRPRAVPFAPNVRRPTPAPPPEPVREPGAAQPLPGPDPTISVTPPLDAFGTDAPTVMWQGMPKLVRTSSARADPLGPVVLDALEPPTGENPREDEDEPPSDPFALPGARWGPPAQEPPAFGPAYAPTAFDEASPFGSTAVAGSAYDATSVDVAPEPEWSTGSKIALALVVVGFLAAVGWVLTQ